MRTLAVPVKPLERAKRRLGHLLSPDERAILTLAMLEDVFDACEGQAGWDVWVVSRDARVLEVAARRGVRPLTETGTSLLEAVRLVEAAVPGPKDELAVVLADLPFAVAPALAEVLSRPGPVVAVPAASDGGTNVLLRRPPSAIRARFGRASFAKHRWAARRAGVSFETADVPELAFDLDRPEDLERVLADRRHRGRTWAVCLEMGLAERLRARA
jgi:2-phospho-L-lactate guanylyltransferase